MGSQIPRTDHKMAAIVDEGIAIAERAGYGDGYVYMRDHNVPLTVVLRVLSSPEQRRTRK